MKYAYTIFYVPNVPATIAFYEKAFGFQKKFVTPEQDYGELFTGETTISFASLELGRSNFGKVNDGGAFEPITPNGKPPGMEMAFITENIQQDFQKAIDAGATKYVDIKTKPWGQQVGYLRDINGAIIEICTPVKPSTT